MNSIDTYSDSDCLVEPISCLVYKNINDSTIQGLITEFIQLNNLDLTDTAFLIQPLKYILQTILINVIESIFRDINNYSQDTIFTILHSIIPVIIKSSLVGVAGGKNEFLNVLLENSNKFKHVNSETRQIIIASFIDLLNTFIQTTIMADLNVLIHDIVNPIPNKILSYPWIGGEINAYYMWQGNYNANSTDTPNSWYTSLSAKITQADALNNDQSNLQYTTSGSFSYNIVPTSAPWNSIFVFTGNGDLRNTFTNDSFINYTTNTNMISTATDYFANTSTPYLIGLVIGGGAASSGSWNTGNSTAQVQSAYSSNMVYSQNCGIFSVYQAATQPGVPFCYTETGTNNKIFGIGNGNLGITSTSSTNPQTYPFNCLIFDVETWGGYGGSPPASAEPGCQDGSSGQDFINLFKYIKTNSNTIYSGVHSLPIPIIIVTMSHSCGNYNGTGATQIPILFQNDGSYIDYISPQIYTCNLGQMNEYAANFNLAWTGDTSFKSYISESTQYSKYGLNMLLPSINLSDLYTTGGTNNNNPPNLYYYETDYSTQYNIGVPTADISATFDMDGRFNTTDTGAVDFFNIVFDKNVSDIGGYIQWVNGDLSS